jgi:hypothetical protein
MPQIWALISVVLASDPTLWLPLIPLALAALIKFGDAIRAGQWEHWTRLIDALLHWLSSKLDWGVWGTHFSRGHWGRAARARGTEAGRNWSPLARHHRSAGAPSHCRCGEAGSRACLFVAVTGDSLRARLLVWFISGEAEAARRWAAATSGACGAWWRRRREAQGRWLRRTEEGAHGVDKVGHQAVLMGWAVAIRGSRRIQLRVLGLFKTGYADTARIRWSIRVSELITDLVSPSQIISHFDFS